MEGKKLNLVYFDLSQDPDACLAFIFCSYASPIILSFSFKTKASSKSVQARHSIFRTPALLSVYTY
jgi:hypothetical protein